MFKKELMIPALLGLGLYAQNSDVSLSNNTTMLISLFVLLEEHEKINELENKIHRLEHIELCDYYKPRDTRYPYPDECCRKQRRFF